jgi:hypothetical protein
MEVNLMVPFKIGSIYTFNTLAPTVLESVMRNVRILSIMSYDLANSYINVDIMQKSIYPLLPSGTPSNPRDYVYILFETEAKIKTVLAIDWIDINSIQEVTTVTINIRVDRAAIEDIPKIRDTLKLMGFTNLNISSKYD